VKGISIVIPTYNRARLLGPTLASVKGLRVPDEACVELVVIDNNCTDGTPKVVEAAANDGPFPLRRAVETRQGLCYGRNRGLEEARYEHVIYLDDDVEVAPDWLLGYLDAVERFQADCVVGPVSPKFEEPVPDYVTPRIVQSIDSYYSRKGDRMYLLPPEDAHEVPGCNFGVRRSVALEIGGFNNAFDRVGTGLLAGGDTEFAKRLAAAGKRVVYQPRCAIGHVITTEKLSRDYLRKRWTGLGATTRKLQDANKRFTAFRRARCALGVGRIYAAHLLHQVLGRPGLAFQRELEARRAWAYLTTRPSRAGQA